MCLLAKEGACTCIATGVRVLPKLVCVLLLSMRTMAMSMRSLSFPRMTCESSALHGCQLFAMRLRIFTSPSPCTVAPLSSKHTFRYLGCVASREQMYHSNDVWIWSTHREHHVRTCTCTKAHQQIMMGLSLVSY